MQIYEGTALPKECSYQFRLGEEYLVYAYGPADKMQASSCLTLGIKNAAEEEKGLDQIKAHKTIRAKSNEASASPFNRRHEIQLAADSPVSGLYS